MRMFVGTTVMLLCFILIGVVITRITSVVDADQFVESCFKECTGSGIQPDRCSRDNISSAYKMLRMNTETFNTCITEGFETRERCIRNFRSNGKQFYRDFMKICPKTYEPMHKLIFSNGAR